MRPFRRHLPLCALIVTACSPAVTSFPIVQPGPALSPDTEVFVSSVRTPECGFEELGVVTATQAPLAGGAKVLEAMKRRAREMGGNGLVAVQAFYAPGGEGDGHGMSATVVRFTDPGCRR